MKHTDIQKKNDSELFELVSTSRENLRAELFKDKFSKKASVIRTAKMIVARTLTEINARRRNQSVK